MKDIITAIALISISAYFIIAAIGEYSNYKKQEQDMELRIEKTKLEIEKLKYELSLYKEQSESIKQLEDVK